jgi:hypothetical protein
MSETIQPNGVPEVPWPTHRDRARAPETSMSPGTNGITPAVAVDSLNRVVQGAHDAVDRFAEVAAPKVRQLGEGASSAETALRAGAEQLGRARGEWTESFRATVRSRPLTAMAAALVLGAVMARIAR